MDYKEKVIAILNSKELSKEQKEKLEYIFPELKESEDEQLTNEEYRTFFDDYIPTITPQMARKWLLQKHELFICIMQTLDLEGNVVYVPTIWKNAMYIGRACKDKNAVFKSDKDAVEMALGYCLTNLI